MFFCSENFGHFLVLFFFEFFSKIFGHFLLFFFFLHQKNFGHFLLFFFSKNFGHFLLFFFSIFFFAPKKFWSLFTVLFFENFCSVDLPKLVFRKCSKRVGNVFFIFFPPIP